MSTRPTLKLFAFIFIALLLGALAVGNYVVLQYAPFGACTIGAALEGAAARGYSVPALECFPYVYYFSGVPLLVMLLLLLGLPRLVTFKGTPAQEKPIDLAVRVRPDRAQPPPATPKAGPDAAVQLLSLLQREGRLVDFLREDIGSYEDAQIGAAVRTIHQTCRQVLAEHVILEPVLNGQEGDEVTVPKDFDPSAIRLTGNVSGEPPFRGALRHPGWRVARLKLPDQPSGQNQKIVAPAEVEIL